MSDSLADSEQKAFEQIYRNLWCRKRKEKAAGVMSESLPQNAIGVRTQEIIHITS